MKHWQRKIGKPRFDLVELLSACGIECYAGDIVPATGRWRNRTGGDGTRFWLTGTTKNFPGKPDGVTVTFNGYSTIKDCVRYGIVIDTTDDEIYSKKDAPNLVKEQQDQEKRKQSKKESSQFD